MKRSKKYGTLNEIMTAGTGMDRNQRKDSVAKSKHWLKIRRNSKKGSKKWREASNKIAEMHGWPQIY